MLHQCSDVCASLQLILQFVLKLRLLSKENAPLRRAPLYISHRPVGPLRSRLLGIAGVKRDFDLFIYFIFLILPATRTHRTALRSAPAFTLESGPTAFPSFPARRLASFCGCGLHKWLLSALISVGVLRRMFCLYFFVGWIELHLTEQMSSNWFPFARFRRCEAVQRASQRL